ncbi:MAG TPA: PAAR domain-containing protein [Herbaspirillum sp.]|uniref:PAAR domain-containing protein n=1 Tax=Herbaspirillum sp. TaxID=1890675 RepID=UPI002D626589|nr:PAAR domain-containing protein [Herbaspirillum sp.]HZG21329.1 PAAR domain-containing protein [Herbaspirillum sp.]
MANAIICKGDSTSHGGTVLEGFATLNVLGKNAAGVGHMVLCPKCKGSFPIVQGAENVSYLGKPVAVEGMKTSCGAELQASQSSVRIGTGSRAATAQKSPHESRDEITEHWYSLEGEDGTPIEGYRFDVYQNEKLMAHQASFSEGRSTVFTGENSSMVLWLAKEGGQP